MSPIFQPDSGISHAETRLVSSKGPTLPIRLHFPSDATSPKPCIRFREVLEALIVCLVTPLLEESDIRELRSCLEKLRATPEEERHVIEYTDSELEFHDLLLRKCPNQMLRRMMEMVNARLQIIRLRTVVLPGRAQKTLDEHAGILEMIEKGNAEEAELLMRRHVISVRTMALENIDAMV